MEPKKNNSPPPPSPPLNVFKGSWFFWVMILIFFLSVMTIDFLGKTHVPQVSYSQFKSFLRDGKVKSVTFKGEEIKGKLKEKLTLTPTSEMQFEEFISRMPQLKDDSLMNLLDAERVEVTAQENKQSWPIVLLINLLPWLLIILFFYYSSRRLRENMGEMGRGGFPFQKSKFKIYQKSPSSLKFSDVAGLDHAKNDLKEIIDFFIRPDKYQQIGAKVPKGVLLMGPPGTGKTLLAKATAGEANIPFYSINGSEFIEVFVGVGASRVRELFENAKKNAPSMIFIDEIDSIGRVRGTGLGGGHDEREQTLNQILSEMDGFTQEEKPIIVMAATNRPDVLDPALIRPGRFDRQITLDLPYKEARKKILDIHLEKVPREKNLNTEQVAAVTTGFSGADLSNLVNEAALNAARHRRDEVIMSDFDYAHDKIIFGNPREEKMSLTDKKIVAYHEAGHALTAILTPYVDPLRKISIIPRGKALGATEQMPVEDRHSVGKNFLEGQIAILLGGRIAELITFHEATSGAEDDLKKATLIARKMVMHLGMSEELGLLSFRQGEEHPFLGREIIQSRDFSEATAAKIDFTVQKIIERKKDEVLTLLQKYQDQLKLLAEKLLEKESLEREEIDSLLQIYK